jgi:translation elongation factor EF-4
MLAACMQAQTLANFYLAFDLDLAIVPVLNKVDLPAADPDRTAAEVQAAFDLPAESCVRTSAKTGVGIDEVLTAIVERIPPPQVPPSYKSACLLLLKLLSAVCNSN